MTADASGSSHPETFRATRSIPSRTACDPPAHEAAGGYGSLVQSHLRHLNIRPRFGPVLWMECRNRWVHPRFGLILWTECQNQRVHPLKGLFLWMGNGILRCRPQNGVFLWMGSGHSGDVRRRTGSYLPSALRRAASKGSPRSSEDNCRGTEAERAVALPRTFF